MFKLNPFKVSRPETSHKHHLGQIYDQLVSIIKTESRWKTRIDNKEFLGKMNIRDDTLRTSNYLSELRLHTLVDMLVLFKGIPKPLLTQTERQSEDIFYGIPDSTMSILCVISNSLNRIAQENPDDAPVRYHIQMFGWNDWITSSFLRACGFEYHDIARLIHLLDRVGIEKNDQFKHLLDIPISELEKKCGMNVNEITSCRNIANALESYKKKQYLCDAKLNFDESSLNRKVHRVNHIKVL